MENRGSEEKNKYFERALADFTYDFANGGTIRHLTDEGYSPSEIAKRLSHRPNPDRVKEEMDNYLFESGRLKEKLDPDHYRLFDKKYHSPGELKKGLSALTMEGEEKRFFARLKKKSLDHLPQSIKLTEREKDYLKELPDMFFVPTKRAFELLCILAVEDKSMVEFYIEEE